MPLWIATAAAAELDLDAVVARATEAGLDAETARIVVASAEETLRLRRRAAGPAVSAGASVGVGAGAGWDSPVDTSARVSASMPIYAGGAIVGERRIAERGVAEAKADQEQTRQDLVLTLAGALLDLESARATVATQEQALAAEEALATRVRALVAAGARTKADSLSEEAAVARQRASLVEARRVVRERQVLLEDLLRVEDVTFVAPTVAPQAGEAERPAVTMRREALEAATLAVDVAGASGRPSLDLGASAGTGWAVGDDPASVVDRASVSGSLDLTVPLWDRGVARSATEQARLDESLARAQLEEAERSARTDVRLAEVQREAAEAGLAAAEAREAAAKAAAAVVEDRYQAGAALLTELLAARAEAVDAAATAAVARVEVVKAGFQVAWARGGL